MVKYNKRGMELPQSVIIIAIIALVVLVVVLAFFAGGFAQIGDRLRGLFSGGVDDQATAVQFCESYCDAAKNFDSEAAIVGSAYCTKWFKLDRDNDGKADKTPEGKIKKFFCGSKHASVPAADEMGIGIECPDLKFQCR